MFYVFQHWTEIRAIDMHCLEEMGDRRRAETEQALYGYMSQERDHDRPAYHYPHHQNIWGRKGEREKKRILQITLWCHQHVTFSQRREKSNQNLTEKAKERGEGRGRMIDLIADKEPERMWAKRENKGKEMQHQRKIKDNSDEWQRGLRYGASSESWTVMLGTVREGGSGVGGQQGQSEKRWPSPQFTVSFNKLK